MQVEKMEIRERGLVATLFSHDETKPGVIILGGSSGGLSEQRAELLASLGFTTLALAYFGESGLPPRLSQIPLEYFEGAFKLMQNHVDKIALWGTSRGAELSLILGTVFPESIDAIAAHVPSSAIYGSFDDPQKPAWVYQGKPLAPEAPFHSVPSTSGQTAEEAIQATGQFLQGMQDKRAFESSQICVEKLNCPLLLISGSDDQMWPSSLFAQQIVDRLKAHQSTIEPVHINYPGVGHAPCIGSVGFHPTLKRWFSYGGNSIDNAFAATDWFHQTVVFLNRVL